MILICKRAESLWLNWRQKEQQPGDRSGDKRVAQHKQKHLLTGADNQVQVWPPRNTDRHLPWGRAFSLVFLKLSSGSGGKENQNLEQGVTIPLSVFFKSQRNLDVLSLPGWDFRRFISDLKAQRNGGCTCGNGVMCKAAGAVYFSSGSVRSL